MATEHVFFDGGDIYVSNTKVILGGTTYATANLTSVSKRLTPASKGCAVALTIIGILMSLGSLGAVFSEDVGSGLVMLVIFAGITAAGIAWFRSLKPTYHVFLSTASGEQRGMSSKDQDLVDRVISAVMNAITARG